MGDPLRLSLTKGRYQCLYKWPAKKLWAAFFRASPWEYVQKLVTKTYIQKYEAVPEFRDWVSQNDRYCRGHYAHFLVEDEMVLWHLRSQLFELTTLLKTRLSKNLPNEGRVLEAGATDGLFMDYLELRSGVGLNILQECVAQVKSQGHLACRADLEDLPFPPKTFARVICTQTLEHVPNPIRTLSEMARVCFGTIHLSISYVASTRVHACSLRYPPQDSDHVFEFCPADFPKVVSHASLRVTYSREVQVFPAITNPFVQALLKKSFYLGFFPKLQYYELGRVEAGP